MIKFIFFLIFLIHCCISNKKILFQYMYIFIYIIFMYRGCFEYFNKISYLVGVDNFSYMLILLRFLIGSLIVISIMGFSMIPIFLIINLSLTIFLIFIFSSLSFIYIYIYFEFILIPLLILIIGWGYQPERLIAGIYLFFYTVLVSLPLLILLLYLYSSEGSLFFDIMNFYSNYFFIHFFIIIVFIVKLPICFVHYWLPKAHVQAPVSGSIILAGLILKIGGYGLIRSTFIYEFIYINYSYIWFSLSIVGSLIISIICLVQADIKCLIAYSSISHIGIVIIGLVTMRNWGLFGAFFLILGHGFCSSGLFYISNLYYLRTGSRRFFINKGLFIYIPRSSMFFFLLCAFNISCPPRLNFVRELIILISLLNFWIFSGWFFLGVSFFCACFSYYLYRYRQHGVPHNLYSFSNINTNEFLCLFIHLCPLLRLPLALISFIYLGSLIKKFRFVDPKMVISPWFCYI